MSRTAARVIARMAAALAALVSARVAFAQADGSFTVRGRRHHDGCATWDEPLGPHRLPAGNTTLPLRAYAGTLAIERTARPGGLRDDEPDSARTRIETVARNDMRSVLETMAPSVVGELERIHLPSHERWLRVSSHIGTVDDRAVIGMTLVSSPHTPLLGSMTENVVVDTRQCPIAYEITSPYGPIACEGRRIEFEVGPTEAMLPGVARYLVMDYCFTGPAGDRQRVVVRPYVVLGRVRSLPPLIRESEMRTFASSVAEDVVWSGASALQSVAGTRFDRPRESDARESQPPSPPASPIDAPRCDRAIASATSRYLALVHALAPGPEPMNADLDEPLQDLLGHFSNDAVAAFDSTAGASPATVTAAYGTLQATMASWSHRGRDRIECRPESPSVRPMRFDCTSTGETRGFLLEATFPIGRAARSTVLVDPPPSFMVRVCAARVSSVFGERLPQGVHAWTRCSELRFDPAPHIEHFASASDTVDPFVVDREPLRIQTDGVRFTPIEGFVARALVEIGRDECVSRVRRLQWSDAPRPRHRRASSPKSWRDTAADR